MYDTKKLSDAYTKTIKFYQPDMYLALGLGIVPVMVIGSGLAAVGGALGGSIFNLDPYMGGLAFMKGITLIVIGGLGSLMGAVAGGLILGICEAVSALFFGSQMGVIIPLILVIAFLIFRPRGLFGHD
jgi:branched-chain amino acid transport system permease protein